MSDNHEMEFVAGVGWYEGEYKKVNLMEKVLSLFLMVGGMKDNLKMERSMAKEHSLFLMGENMLVNGKTE